jgi:hypothetical protein
MIKIAIEVRSSAARFKVALLAESIEGALEMAKRYNPGKECKVVPYRPRELLRQMRQRGMDACAFAIFSTP